MITEQALSPDRSHSPTRARAVPPTWQKIGILKLFLTYTSSIMVALSASISIVFLTSNAGKGNSDKFSVYSFSLRPPFLSKN